MDDPPNYGMDVWQAVFCLDHKDPNLDTVKLGDMFTTMGHEHTVIFDLLDAIDHNLHIKGLHMIYNHLDSFLWSEGMGRDALTIVLHDKTLITHLTVETNQHNTSSIIKVLQHARNLQSLSIYSTRKVPDSSCLHSRLAHL
jgi:hypothetical protein